MKMNSLFPVLALALCVSSVPSVPASAALHGLAGDDCLDVVRAFAKGLELSSAAKRTEATLDSLTESRLYTVRVFVGGAATDAYELVLSNDSAFKCAFESLRTVQTGE